MNVITSTSTANTMVNPFGSYSHIGVPYEGESPQELLTKADLDWQVLLAPITYNVNEEIYNATKDSMIVRADKPSVNFGTCGSKWQPLQNEEVLSTMIRFCDESQDLVKLERVGSFKQGQTIWALASTNKEFTLPGGDKVTGNILLVDHHSAGKGLQVELLTWRQVCSNGMTLPVRIGSKIHAHNAALTTSRISLILYNSFNCFTDFQQKSELLSQASLDLDVVYSFVIKNFNHGKDLNVARPSATDLSKQPKAVRQILDLYLNRAKGGELISSYHTAWGLLNSVTEFINHESTKRGGVERHINSLWLASKAQKQRDTYNQLVSLVGV